MRKSILVPVLSVAAFLLTASAERDEAYRRAQRAVNAKIGFCIHLAVYVIVNIVLVAINLTCSPQYLWFLWPLCGWGIGIFFHGFGVFAFRSGPVMKERMVERETEKLMSRKR
jgi:hypothetical protein